MSKKIGLGNYLIDDETQTIISLVNASKDTLTGDWLYRNQGVCSRLQISQRP